MRGQNRYHRIILLAFLLAAATCCGPGPHRKESPSSGPATDSTSLTADNRPARILLRDGKQLGSPPQQEIFRQMRLDTVDFPIIDQHLTAALEDQLKLLDWREARRSQRVGDLSIYHQDLIQTVRILQYWQQTKPVFMDQYLEAYQITGEDDRGNVRFTGYFTPVLKVKSEPDSLYRFPLYSRPLSWEGPLPTRAQIERDSVLAGQGLELAWADNKIDIYYMQVQGSGYVEYPDGKRELLAYNGTNRHPYRSIEKYLLMREDLEVDNLSINGIRDFLLEHPELSDTVLYQNPSYIFFSRKGTSPKGAGSVPLHAGISIAVDRNYLPLGSCLLAAVPVYDRQDHRVVRHEWRILLAQDVGGAIRGPGHIDLYFGVGPEAKAKASLFKHYGRLWLLLPRDRPLVRVTSN